MCHFFSYKINALSRNKLITNCFLFIIIYREKNNKCLTEWAYGHNLDTKQAQHLVPAKTKIEPFWVLADEKLGIGERGTLRSFFGVLYDESGVS